MLNAFAIIFKKQISIWHRNDTSVGEEGLKPLSDEFEAKLPDLIARRKG